MEKRKKTTRFLKNRNWKSKIANRLKGRAEDVCRDYEFGAIDSQKPIHVTNGPKRWLTKFFDTRKMEDAS